jgi:hypothetical protein
VAKDTAAANRSRVAKGGGASPEEADSWVDHLRNDAHENYTPISLWERLIRNFSPNVRRGGRKQTSAARKDLNQ